MRKTLAILAALAATPAAAQVVPFGMPVTAPGNPNNNNMVVSDATGSGLTNYPLQFGRPFLDGAVPHSPQLLVNGSAITSQADVKNRYPDGSVEFAVVSAVIPSVPPNGSITLTFADNPTPNNTPLTQAQMLDPAYGFDATMTVDAPGAVFGAQLASNIITPWQAITAGGFAVTIDGTTYQITGLNFSASANLAAVATAINTALTTAGAPAKLYFDTISNANRTPAGAATATTYRFRLVGNDTTGSGLISVLSAPSSGTDISATLGLNAPAALAQGSVQSVSARTMLTNGDYGPWTLGPVSQTIRLGDDTLARKYDIGLGDGFHPLRPHFYATFWPATHQVFVRAEMENDLVDQIEDQTYSVSIPQISYSKANVAHYAFTSWDKTWWENGTPPQQVNIAYNLPYLESTRFLPNFDSSIVVPVSADTNEYTQWSATPRDILQAGAWTPGMGEAGARCEIAPFPCWYMLPLYSADWHARAVMLGQADLAGFFPGRLRETVAGKRLSRADAAGLSTGLGHFVSTVDRKTLVAQSPTYGYTYVGDRITFVGPYSAADPAEFETSHTPAAYSVPYLLTGDEYYLHGMYAWASFTQAYTNGASGGNDGRGPDGSYGCIRAQSYRGGAWSMRNRMEAAFFAPDTDADKAQLVYLTNDGIACYEGMFGIADPVYDGAPIKTWSAAGGNNWSSNNGPVSGKTPSLAMGELESGAYPNGKDGSIAIDVNAGFFCATAAAQPSLTVPFPCADGVSVGSFTAPWGHHYLSYVLGRLEELGFAADPFRMVNSRFQIGMINSTGYPQMISMYEIPTEYQCEAVAGTLPCTAPPGGFITSWAGEVAAIPPQFLTGVGWNTALGAALPTYYTQNLQDDGRVMWAMGGLAMAVDHGDPGAAAAWAWYLPNGYQAVPAASLQLDPKWAILPRTDSNVLPAFPTVTP